MPPSPDLAMPKRSLPARLALLALLAAPVLAAPLAAQRALVGVDVNAASESDAERAPLLFAGAGLAPRHRLGVSVQSTASRIESDLRDIDGTMTGSKTTGYRTTGSAFFGLTSRITVGAYLSGVQRVRHERDAAAAAAGARQVVIEPGADSTPTRQGTRTPLGDAEIGAHARIGLWDSDRTRIAASVGLDDAVDSDIATSVGLALQHRVGGITFHVTPALRAREGVGGGGEVATVFAGRIGAAAVAAIHRRASLSLELLRDGFDLGTTDAAVGTRWRFGRLAVDAGIRGLVDHNTAAENASRYAATVGTHWTF